MTRHFCDRCGVERAGNALRLLALDVSPLTEDLAVAGIDRRSRYVLCPACLADVTAHLDAAVEPTKGGAA